MINNIKKDEITYLLKVLENYKKKGNFTIDTVESITRCVGLKECDFNNGVQKKVTDLTSQFQTICSELKAYGYNDDKFNYIWNTPRNKMTPDERLDYIKLYCPLDYNHLEKGIKKIFKFMDKNHISHESKASFKMRADNVVIRLKKDDYEGARKVIDFINSDEYLKEGMNQVNPLLPTIGNVGCVVDKDEYNKNKKTFNWESMCVLYDYVKNNDNISYEGFMNHLQNSKLLNEMIKESNELISKIKSVNPKVSIYSSFKEKISSHFKLQNKDNIDKKQDVQESDLKPQIDYRNCFDMAITATVVNYGINHTSLALQKILSGDVTGYNGISRNFKNAYDNNNYRELFKQIPLTELRKIVNSVYYKDYLNNMMKYKSDRFNRLFESAINNPNVSVGGLISGRIDNLEQLPKEISIVARLPYDEKIYYIKRKLIEDGYNISDVNDQNLVNNYVNIVKNPQTNSGMSR